MAPRFTVTCQDCGWSAKTRHSEPMKPKKGHPGHKCPSCGSAKLVIQ